MDDLITAYSYSNQNSSCVLFYKAFVERSSLQKWHRVFHAFYLACRRKMASCATRGLSYSDRSSAIITSLWSTLTARRTTISVCHHQIFKQHFVDAVFQCLIFFAVSVRENIRRKLLLTPDRPLFRWSNVYDYCREYPSAYLLNPHEAVSQSQRKHRFSLPTPTPE